MKISTKIQIVFVSLIIFGSLSHSENIRATITYPSTITNDNDGPLDLKAEINYNNSVTNAPVMVVMHGFSGSGGFFLDYRIVAVHFRDLGFFAVTVAMRGRDGSDGVRNTGGAEIYDIYDAVEYIKGNYSDYADSTNINIMGYSGGGGNTFSALTKFPDYFRSGAPFFGMSDYGYHPTQGWYFHDDDAGHRGIMDTDIGDPRIGDPDIQDKYHARASNLASRNNPYSEIHAFVNYNEHTCNTFHSTTYRDNAVLHESFSGEFDNITVHIGSTGVYEDFNNNGINEANELQWWPHGNPEVINSLAAANGWYIDRVLNGSIGAPVLNSEDSLFVAGFVKTKQFECWIGDGQNGAGELSYSLSATQKRFEFSVASNNKTIISRIEINTNDMYGQLVDVILNGTVISSFSAQEKYTYGNLLHGHTLIVKLKGSTILIEPDKQSSIINDRIVTSPNPYIPGGRLLVVLPRMYRNKWFKVSILDSQGKYVKDFKNSARDIVWDGLNSCGIRVPSGYYYLKIDSGTQSFCKTLILEK
ncbi:MAG: prolyl oligopeptidase family serine peptidase [bacterium]